ncbi:MAG: sulfite reductase flavoprotein subunit alpha, partial [Opitutales bacterium]
FGSESGNSENCAQQIEVAAKAEGFKTSVVDMGDYDASRLESEENVLIVVSTWGEGDPPERASDFHAFVMGESAPKLEKVNFAVCALGDTGYADFCECGKQFDRRFAELGAKRIFDRVDCDVDFEEPFAEWQKGALAAMVEATGVKEKATAPAAVAAPVEAMAGAASTAFGGVAAPVAEPWSKKNPYPALLKNRFLLNGSGSKKETLHVELDLGDSGMTYEPGDVLGAFATNCPEVVDDFVRLAGFRGDEIREENGEYHSLSELLATYDVTSLSKAFMKKYAPLAKNKALDRVLDDAQADKLGDWLWGRELRDLFLEFPPSDMLSVDQVLNLLRKLPPRLYSIASSIQAHPNEVHLTIAAVRYNAHEKVRKGVCSTYFADRIDVGENVPVYLHHNKNFKLPADPNTPIIMVGPGTGIAPFRAFVEERVETGAKGKSWLFFGDWTFQNDFLYQTEWQKYLKTGGLSRMDVAFSRDTDQKVYVQHRMREKSKELYAWLEEGAHFYVCGDASRMAKDVHQALIDCVAEHGGMSPEDAEAYVKDLQKSKRYQRDVY